MALAFFFSMELFSTLEKILSLEERHWKRQQSRNARQKPLPMYTPRQQLHQIQPILKTPEDYRTGYTLRRVKWHNHDGTQTLLFLPKNLEGEQSRKGISTKDPAHLALEISSGNISLHHIGLS